MGFTLTTLYADVKASGINTTNRGIDSVRGHVAGADSRLTMLMAKAKAVFAVAIPLAIAHTVRAFAAQEKAENAIASALDSHGDSLDGMLPALKAQAATIQNLTVYGDEFILGLMAQARNLGTTSGKLDEVTRRAVGLSKALGMDLRTALRYTVLAQQGEFTMLQRYIPVLRSATTETEKLTIVNEMAARGWSQARAEIETTSGKYQQLKNTLGDWAEWIGEGVAYTATVVATDFGDYIDGLREAAAYWGLIAERSKAAAGAGKPLWEAVPGSAKTFDDLAKEDPARYQYFATSDMEKIGTGADASYYSVKQLKAELADLQILLYQFDAEDWAAEMAEAQWKIDVGGGSAHEPGGAGAQANAVPAFIADGRDRIADMAAGAQVGLLEALGLGKEAEIARVNAWLKAELDKVETAFNDVALDLDADGLAQFEAIRDALEETARLRKEGVDEGPQAQAQFMGQQEWVRQIQAAVGSGGDVAKQQLDEAKKQTALTAEQNALIKNLDMAVTS